MTPHVKEQVEAALANTFVNQIHISVNPSQAFCDLSDVLFLSPRIRITLQKYDLGLYGNFRFLIQSATAPYIAIQCADDQQTADYQNVCLALRKSSCVLGIPTWHWSEFDPQKGGHFGAPKDGVYPNTESKNALLLDAEKAEPSWIFGIWESEYIKEHFPKEDFDWLDFYLLQKVCCDERVKRIETVTPLIIGTWNWAGKSPHSVDPLGPFAKTWSLKFLGLWFEKKLFRHPLITYKWLRRLVIINVRASSQRMKKGNK